MSKPTKNDVIHFIETDRTLTTGRNLYNRFPNKSLAIQQFLSRMPNTEKTVKQLCYELCKLVGLSEQQMLSYFSKPVREASKTAAKVIPIKRVLSREEQLLQLDPESATFKVDILPLLSMKRGLILPNFSKGLPGIKERKEFLKKFEWDHKAKSAKALDAELEALKASKEGDQTEDIKAILKERNAALATAASVMPNPVKEKIKMWEQFPFLREKECPDEYKILVSDLITAYHTYMATQPGLHNALTDADRKAIADTVKENYILNKQIWDELEYYRDNKKPLGKHPIFKEEADRKELKAMDGDVLSKKVATLRANITRNTQKATDEKRTPEQREKSASLTKEQEALLGMAVKELKNR